MDCGESDSDSSSSSIDSNIAENRKRTFGACRPRIVAKDVLTPEEPPLPPVAEEPRPWGVEHFSAGTSDCLKKPK